MVEREWDYQPEKIVHSITKEDIQDWAMMSIGRGLTGDEIEKVMDVFTDTLFEHFEICLHEVTFRAIDKA